MAQAECDSGQLRRQLATQKAATRDPSSIGPEKGHHGDRQETLDAREHPALSSDANSAVDLLGRT